MEKKERKGKIGLAEGNAKLEIKEGKAKEGRGKMEIREGRAKLTAPDGVFFNPEMKNCRDIASLWVGAIGEELDLLDGFCASGARGIRYALENGNVKRVVFVDMSKRAIAACRKNIKANKITKKGKAVQQDIRELLLGQNYNFNFIEIDPFGTPAPFLADAMRHGDKRQARWLSITATDMAVLCGAHFAACVKNYSSRPINNEFCHEAAVRILAGKIAREAAAENWGCAVELALSHKHYVKVFVRLEPSAEKAVESAKMAMQHLSYCRKCGWRKMGKFPEAKCGECGYLAEWAGQMWGGSLFEKGRIAKMIELHGERKGVYDGASGKLLNTIFGECGGPAFYHDLHELASREKKRIPPIGEMIEKLGKKGYFASRTHFSPTAVRTDAKAGDIVARMG